MLAAMRLLLVRIWRQTDPGPAEGLMRMAVQCHSVCYARRAGRQPEGYRVGLFVSIPLAETGASDIGNSPTKSNERKMARGYGFS